MGAVGLVGATGVNGATGATGAAGTKGATGATGVTGSNGDKGATGATGAIGQDGAQGAAGVVGPDGPIGPQGAQGEQGAYDDLSDLVAKVNDLSIQLTALQTLQAAIVPNAPSNISVVATDGSATINFDAPAPNNGNAPTSYTVTSVPGGLTATSSGSPITITGLTDGVSYTFTVTATNTGGSSAASAPSASVTPVAPAPTFSFYNDPSIYGPFSITTGPDGALWFTNFYSATIGRIDPVTGVVANYTDPNGSINGPQSILTSPDGALWFTNVYNNSLGRIDPATGVITNYTNPSINYPNAITVGPDGALWFVNTNNNSIGRMDPATGAITNYTDPNGSISSPNGITTGPDGALWFTNAGNNSIGRIDPVTGIVTNFPDPSISYPYQIVTGPDGTLWFGNAGGNSIGRIDPVTGIITFDTDPSISSNYFITAGPDGALWFSNAGGNSIGRVDPATGIVTNYSDPGIRTPYGITVGSDGALWFASINGGSIGRLALPTAAGATVPSAPTLTGMVAGNGQATVTFNPSASDGGAPITGYIVTAYPGGLTASGTTSPLTVSGLTPGQSYTFTVIAINSVGSSAPSAASNSVTLPEAPGAPTITSVTVLPAIGDTIYLPGYPDDGTIEKFATDGTDLGVFVSGLSSIYGVVVDQAGNVYVSLSYLGEVEEYAPDGTDLGVFANGFYFAGPLAFDPAGNLYVTDYDRVDEFAPDGTSLGSFAFYTYPRSLAFDSAGNLYVTTNYGYIEKFDANQNDRGVFAYGTAVTVDGEDNVYVANGDNNSVEKYAADGTDLGLFANNTGFSPDLAVDSANNLYVLEVNSSVIQAFSPAGQNLGAVNYPNGNSFPYYFTIGAGSGDPALGAAEVSFSPPASNGGSAITSYTVTSSPDGLTKSGTGNPIRISGLVRGESYTFTVTATNAVGEGAASDPSALTFIPTAPDAPVITNVIAGDHQVTVYFDPSANDGGAAITSYTVSSFPGSLSASGTSSPITITGLIDGAPYTFTVTATSSAGTSGASARSAQVIAAVPVTAPDSPTVTDVQADDGQVTVTFDPPDSDGGAPITSYTVTSIPDGITATGATSPITVTGLTDGTSYTFTVTAANQDGNSVASAASAVVIPIGLPKAPVITDVIPGDGELTVFIANLNSGGAPIVSYTASTDIGPVSLTSVSNVVELTGLTNGVAYEISAYITTLFGNSPTVTASQEYIPASVPGTPIGSTTGPAVTVNGTQADIELSTAEANGGTPILHWDVTTTPPTTLTSSTSPSFTVSGLTPGVVYTFQVTATNAVGTSAATTLVPDSPVGTLIVLAQNVIGASIDARNGYLVNVDGSEVDPSNSQNVIPAPVNPSFALFQSGYGLIVTQDPLANGQVTTYSDTWVDLTTSPPTVYDSNSNTFSETDPIFYITTINTVVNVNDLNVQLDPTTLQPLPTSQQGAYEIVQTPAGYSMSSNAPTE